MASASQSPPGSAAAQKRRSDDGAIQPRAKRNRYISIACNECKRRKIKCNGQSPCQRCGNLSLECTYAPNCCNNFKESDEFKQMSAHMSQLQEQVEQLFASLDALKSHVDVQPASSMMDTPFAAAEYPYTMTTLGPTPAHSDSPSRSRTKSSSKHPRFHGLTSSAFTLGVAKSSLRTMGITEPEDVEDDGADSQEKTPEEEPPPFPFTALPEPLHTTKDPIWALSKDEALRLVNVWYEEMGIMYPFLDMEKVMQHTNMLFSFIEAATRQGLMQGAKAGADAIEDDQTSILKLILATALIVEGNGTDALGERLFSNVLNVVRRVSTEPVELSKITLLVMTSMYYFHRDDEPLAWRMNGLAARNCFELGLHRRETYDTLTNSHEHAEAIRLFWSIYVLDRRWSFGTGLPFALQDHDMDVNLPKPDDSSPYLHAMISYSNLGSRVWSSITSPEAARGTINNEEMGFLDFQVLNWHRSIPESLRFVHPDRGQPSDPPSRGLLRLQVSLYLRANQMRILIYRPVLHSATSIAENTDFADTIVKVSKDTIQILTYVNRTTDLYKAQQTTFNYFLISALAVLFLAVAHAPAQFNTQCRDEFYMALDLVRGLSADSYVSRRLWKTIKMLKEVGPRLGLKIRNDATSAAHSSAAVAMAGLAGHPVDEMAIFTNEPKGSLDTPHGMASDLTNLFEAAGGVCNGLNNVFRLSGDGDMARDDATPCGQESDELARILRDLF